MPRSPKPTRKRKTNVRGSLLSPESTGGINAGKGFDFQTRYTACNLPVWLLEAAFHQLFFEGTGDIDIRYEEQGRSVRVHLQIKDHEVTAAEFKKVVAQFRKVDADFPGLYKCFTLVCTGVAPTLRPVEAGLSRLRNSKPFYDDAAHALASTRQELAQRLRRVGLGDDENVAFIEAKVAIEIGHGDYHHDDRSVDLFIGRLLNHPEYADKIRAMVQPAFAHLLRAIEGKRGAVLKRSDLEHILRTAVSAAAPAERGITVWIQNWTKEKFDVPADYELDWSSLFDRGSRRVPAPDAWNTQLLPELKSLKDKITADRSERFIRLRGKCSLSTGIALGVTFPAVGGWTFEVPQPPAKEPWRSDAVSTNSYDLHVELIDGGGTDLVLGLNIRGDGREDVRRYIAETGAPPRLFAFMAPSSPGSQSIGGAGDACTFARAVREQLGQLAKTHGIKRTRIFFYGPFALSVFLGQQLTSVGELQLFEYQDPGYVPSCTLRT